MPEVLSATSVGSTVTSVSQQVTLTEGNSYEVMLTGNGWIKLGANPTAAPSTTGNIYCPAGVPRYVCADAGNIKLAVIRDTADGYITITRLL